MPTQKILAATQLNPPSSGGGVSWNLISADQVAVVNNGYICNKGTLLVLTLPATSSIGDVIGVAGMNAGLWKVAQGAGQIIHFGNKNTSTGTGGYLASVLTYDTIELLCITANNEWVVTRSIGNITVV